MPAKPSKTAGATHNHARRAALGAVVALLVGGAVARADPGARLDQVRSKIESTQGQLRHTRGRAQVLTTDIAGLTTRIRSLQDDITRLRARQATLQSDLDAKRRELLRLQAELRDARAELARLRLRLAHAREVLAERVVALYESDAPDLISVVLNSHDFSDLLENTHYLTQIGAQDGRIIEAVRTARAETTRLVTRLDSLEARQRVLTEAVLRRRDAVAGVRIAIEERQRRYAAVRARRARTLAAVRTSASGLRRHLDFLQGEEASIERRIQAAQAAAAGGSAALPAGPIRGGGQLIWPVNGPITSPFCEARSWESCHPGLDIGVPGGTPIRAAGAGRVVLAGPSSGYGNYTCIQHTGALSTCYAHQSSIGVHVGQSVAQGQVIGNVGCTGLCFGDHLHFEVRVDGAVANPLNYL